MKKFILTTAVAVAIIGQALCQIDVVDNKVGIGMTPNSNTNEKLTVEGKSILKGDLKIGETNSTKNLEVSGISTLKSAVIGTANSADLNLSVNGNSLFSGNVRVGETTNTAHKFFISGNSFLKGDLEIGENNNTKILKVFGSGTFSGNLLVNGDKPVANLSQEQTFLEKQTFNKNVIVGGNLGVGFSSPTQKMHVEGTTFLNGNVGIGIAPSTYKFQVAGNSNMIGALQVGNASISGITLDVLGIVKFTPSEVSSSMLLESYKENFGGIFSEHIPVLYPVSNNGASLGKSDRRFYRISVFNVDCPISVSPSDMRIKENIRPCSPLLSKIKDVKSYNFNFVDKFYEGLTKEETEYWKRMQYGFIAQEVMEIFPELVYERDSEGMLSIDYVSMVPILTAAINELRQEVEDLRRALAEYGIFVNPKSNEDEETSTVQFNLSNPTNTDNEKMTVEQNAPNPFNQNTTIKCFIPKSIIKAQLCVYDMQGVQVKCIEIAERGNVNVIIEAGKLSSGIYSYLLLGDAKTSEAKQMILTK